MRVPIFDSRGEVIGSEPAPQRYCSEEEQKRIRQEKARHNYFYQEGYDDGISGAVSRDSIIFLAQGRNSFESYCRGYSQGMSDTGKCPCCGEEHYDTWGE